MHDQGQVRGWRRQTEKRKVGSSTLPLTTSFGRVSSALTSANADWALPRLQPPSDHDCPCVTVVGRSLSHADRTPCLRAPGLRPLRPELAVALVLTGRPSVFQAGHIPSWRGSCERYALSPVAAASHWSLLLLSRLLSTRRTPSVAIGPAACRGWPASGPGRLRPGPWFLTGVSAEAPGSSMTSRVRPPGTFSCARCPAVNSHA